MRRRLMSGLLGAGLLVSTATGALAQSCASPTDEHVFEVEALKSMLIVLATSCHADQPYNAFVNRYKPELANTEHEFDAYFKRVYGRRGQTEHDSYITQLANAQFDVGLKQGGDFCPRNQAIFDEVMTLRGPTDLEPYAAGKALLPPTLGSCATTVTEPSRRGPVRHVSTHKKA